MILLRGKGLKNKMREMETFINNIPHMAWLKDIDSNFMLVNQKFGNVVGMDPEYLRNNSCAVCFGEEAAKKFKEDDRVVMEGKKQVTLEETIVDKDGKEIILETTKSPIFNYTGDVIGTVGIGIDITERRNMEKQLRELSDNLTQKVEEQTLELKKTQEKLIYRSKMEAVGKFAGGISGKLKSPFEIINNSLFNLRLKLKDAGGDVRRNLNIIQNAVDRACDLILGLPEYYKFKLPMLIKSDVNNIVKEALRDIKIQENINIESQLDNNLPSIDLDPNQIKQAFINIILNAVQAMPNGGKLTIRTQLKDDCIEVDFKDTGEGIAEENLEELFEPLFSTKAENIGLGLPLVKDIIDKHNGKVTIESKIGEGTKITINLPISQNKNKDT
ncbi:MAG: nitrogen regulation protein NR(II) [Candidatus Hodarchaeota archaeon]